MAEQARQDEFVCLAFRESVEFILKRKCGGQELFRLVAIVKSLREQEGIKLGLNLIVSSASRNDLQ